MLLTKRAAFLFLLGGAICVSSGFAQEEKKAEEPGKTADLAEVQQDDATEKAATEQDATEVDSAEKSDSTDKSGEDAKATAQDDGQRPDFNSGKLTFQFKNTEWGKVIRWFADEAQLDLNMAVTPEGSFNYSSNGEFTLLQAMDIINSFLIREQGYILLRHANLIIVHDLNNEIPPTMIETIQIGELDNRGEYELTQTEFDISGFDGNKFSGDIERLIREDQGGKQLLVESSEILFVRETGGRLRLIRKYLEMAKSIAGGKESKVQIVELKFVTPEEVMTVATELIPLDDENLFEDNDSGERLKVVVQSFGNKFILQGTAKTLKRFESLVTMLDKESKAETVNGDLAQPVTKRYPVAADRELTLQVLRTMMAGTEGLRLALAEEAGEIIAYAPPETHQLIAEILASLQSDSSDFQVIRLNDYDADSMIEILNKMYGIAEEGEAMPNQPVFMADPLYSDQLIAKAKPTQLAAIKKLVTSIDPPIGEGGSYDKNYLQLDYRGKQADMAIQMLQDYYGALGRPNKFNVIRSNAAKQDSIEIERRNNSLQQIPKNTDPANGFEADPRKDVAPKGGIDTAPEKKTGTTTTAIQPKSNFLTVSTLQEDDEEKKTKAKQGDIQTVEGAPILIRENAAGLMIITDDLKALAEIKRLLDEHEEMINRPSLPTIIELKHRKAIEMKDLLEMFLGLSSDGGGGGGGGLGGMLGGMAQNAIGGMAGQMIGGLMGGGGGTADSGVVASDLLTGDVRIDADALKNVLLVQANPIDMETILEYINYFDTDGAAQNPELDGRTYTIRVQYRDAVNLSEIVKAQFPNRLATTKTQSSQGNAQAQQIQMLQQLMRGGGRGGRGGGGQKTVEQSEPKMTVGVDEDMNAILVTGPEFLYEQVNFLVQQLDQPDAVKDGTVVVVGLKNLRPDGLKEAINSLQAESAGTSSNRRTTGRTGTTGGGMPSTGNPVLDAMRQRMMQGGGGGGFTAPGRGATGGRGGATGGRGGGGGRGGRGGGR